MDTNKSRRLFKREEHHLPLEFSGDIYDEDLPVVVLGHIAAMHPELYSRREETLYEGEINNSSYDGLRFQSGRSFKPGTKILLKKANFDKLSFGLKRFKECHAIIKWCKKVEDTTPPCYHIGVKRVRTKKLPMINWKSPKFAPIKCF